MKRCLYLFLAFFLISALAACSDDDGSEKTPKLKVSIQSNGVEINDGDIVRYEAGKNVFGEYVAGHDTEPLFVMNIPCILEVTVTLPSNDLDYLKWCGITRQCENLKKAGTYTRVTVQPVSREQMEIQACFKAGVSATCRIKVDVKVNGKPERAFFMEYVFKDPDEDVDDRDSVYARPAYRSPVVAVEFTGQRCPYCPIMSQNLSGLQNIYGKDNFIVAAIHAFEKFSSLPGNEVSLFHAEGQEYCKSMDATAGLPQLYYNTLGTVVPDNPLEDVFYEKDLLECKGHVTANGSGQYGISFRTRLRRDCKDTLAGRKTDVIVWALENGIKAYQNSSGQSTWPRHDHVFRGSVNGTWGEPYEAGTEYAGTFPVPAAVTDVEKTEVVVLFVDHSTKVILDAARFKVERAS